MTASDPRHDGAPDAGDPPWRMLHPASLAVNLLPRAWGLVRSLWPFLLIALFGGRDDGAGLFADLSFLLVFFLLAVGNTVVHFLTLRYRMADGRLEIRTGLLQRNVRVISPRKVQNVEMVRNVFHRASGLVEVRIETASGDEVEGMLSALTEEEAQRLVTALSTARGHAGRDADAEADAPVLVQNDLDDILRYGATGTRWGAAAVGLGVLFEAWSSMAPDEAVDVTVALGVAGAAGLFVVALVGAWFLGVVNAVVRHHGFALREVDGALVAREGLLTTRRVELPIRKVQRVSVRAPWMRRLLGMTSVVVESAAAQAGTGGTQRSVTMVPVLHPDRVDAIVRVALPRADVLQDTPFERPHPMALRRALIRGALQGVLLAGFAAWWWWPWGAAALLLVPVPMVLGWLDWRHQGFLVTDELVVSRRGYLNRVTTIVARDKLQSVDVSQGPLLRRYGLGEVVVRVAGSGVTMPLIEHARAYQLASSLSARAGGAGRAARRRPAPAGSRAPAPPPTGSAGWAR